MDEGRQRQVNELLEKLYFNKVDVATPPEKTDDGQVVETIRRSKQIKDCSFGELLSIFQQGIDKTYDVEVKVTFKEPKN